MHLKKVFFTILVLFLAHGMYAQQAAMFSQNMFTYTAINPGSFAINDAISAIGIARQQWAGFQDADGYSVAPQTYLVSAAAPIETLKGGIGINIIQDKLGFFKDVGIGVGYAYKLNFLEGVLGIGGQINFLNRKIDFSKFKPIQDGDPVLGNEGETSDLITDFSIGLFYNVANQYYVGISVANLMESNGNTFTATTTGAPQTDRIYYIIAGYEFIFPRRPMLKFNPSVLVKSDLAVTQISVSGLLTYSNKFRGGVTYNVQTADAFAILLGLNIKDLKIGYAYDLPLSSINPRGSHEIMVGYRFKLSIKKKKESYRNTRFL